MSTPPILAGMLGTRTLFQGRVLSLRASTVEPLKFKSKGSNDEHTLQLIFQPTNIAIRLVESPYNTRLFAYAARHHLDNTT